MYRSILVINLITVPWKVWKNKLYLTLYGKWYIFQKLRFIIIIILVWNLKFQQFVILIYKDMIVSKCSDLFNSSRAYLSPTSNWKSSSAVFFYASETCESSNIYSFIRWSRISGSHGTIGKLSTLHGHYNLFVETMVYPGRQD